MIFLKLEKILNIFIKFGNQIMLQLFKESFNFAWQEMKSRWSFWYKTCIVILAKFCIVTVLLTSAMLATVFVGFWSRQYIPQNFFMAWTVLVWSAGFLITAFCLYLAIKKLIAFFMSLMATFLAGAKEQHPTTIVSEKAVAPFSCLFFMLVFFGAVIGVGQQLIIFYTGSKIAGALFAMVVSFWISARLHFSYYMILEKKVHAVSACSIAFAALKESFKLTKHKFGQLFFIVFLYQIVSYLGMLVPAFDASQSFIIGMFIVLMIVSILALPLFLLMQARAYVLLTSKNS